MATEHWFRWHHGTVTDPKWRVIAARASASMSRNVTPCHVVSVWAAMLECASQAQARGTLEGWCDEDIAAALGIEEEEVAAIRVAMQGKVLDGDAMTAWNRRQPRREDVSASERKRAQRAKSADVTESDKDVSHDESRNVTQCHARGEERRVEKKEKKHVRSRAPSKTSLPADFSISDRVRSWAAEKGHGHLDQHLESFRNKALAKGYTYADWDMAFMEAIRENWAKVGVVHPFSGNVARAPSDVADQAGGGRRAL